MIVTSFRAILLLILLVSSTFTSLIFTGAHAATNLVTVTASNNDLITTLHFNNNGENISDISSIILQISQSVNFKSFKSDKGWFGIKSSPNTLTFSSTNPTKPGQSVNFIVKTDQSNPVITWKSLNNNNNELGSGEIDTSSPETPTNPNGTTENIPPNKSPGVLDGSSFRVIPSTPRTGTDVRVIGLGFAATANLDLYIGANKINSFTTNDKGNFIITTKIPDDQPFGVYTIEVSDGKNKVSRSYNIVTTHQILISTSQSKIEPGQTLVINGTSISNQPISFRIIDPTGNTVFTKDANVTSDGKIAITYSTDSAAVTGTYKLIATKGNDQVTAYFGVGEPVVPQ